MATFVNHVAIAAPRNGTSAHTVAPSAGTVVAGTLFTPTAGRLLVCVAYGAVTSGTTTGVPASPPVGWSEPTGSTGEAVNNGGLYVWFKTAAGGSSDDVVVNHNGPNFPLVFDFYEFAAGSTFGTSATATGVSNAGGAGPTLSGLSTSVTSWRAGIVARSDAALNPTTSGFTITWNAGTEAVETAEVRAGTPTTDGYQYGLTYLEAATATQAFAATYAVAGGSATSERLVISVNAVAPSAPIPSGAAASGTTWAGTSVGVAPVLVAQGSASSGTTWAGTAVGTRLSSGAAASGTTWSGTAAGPSSALSIAAENALTGRARSLWYDGVGSEQMPAFARSTYYQPGQTAEFSVNFSSAFTFEIIRLGHYSDVGGRRVAGPISGTPASQPAPAAISGGNGAVDCAAWSKNVTWAIPTDVTPGWYYLYLTDGSSNYGHALFCVTDKLAKKPVLAVTGDATWHAAYNGFGGNNVYGATKGVGDINARAYCSSYDKPVITKDYVPQTHFFNAAWASFKYLESLGVEVGYTTIEQINNDPTILDGRSVIIFSGHNEYISQPVMDKTKALLAGGQKIVNWAANDFFWRVKFGSPTGMNTPGRVVWCKKDTMAGPSGSGHAAGTAFTTQADWTGTWQDTRWTLREPSSAFLGDRFIANGIRNDSVKVPFAMKTSPLWRSCSGVQALTSGQEFVFGAGSLGMEWDMPEGSLPTVRLSSSTVNLAGNCSDVNGEAYNLNGSPEHSIAVSRSGAGLVFNYNTDQWGKTLDDMNIRHGNIANANARQACLNMLVDVGVTPSSTMVTAASLTMPTAVTGDVGVAYGLASVPNAGAASSGTTWAGTSVGSSPVKGSASSGTTWSGTSVGTSPSKGAAAGGTTWSGTAAGSAPVSGSASSGTVWSGTSVGTAPAIGVPVGTASSGTTWSGVGQGSTVMRGAASSGTTWSGTSSGFAPVAPGVPVGGASSGTVWSGVATGVRFAFGSAISGTVWSGVASGPGAGEPLLLTAGPALRSPYSVSTPTILGSPAVSEPIYSDDPDAHRLYPITRAGGSAFDFTPKVRVRGLDVEITASWATGPGSTRNLKVPLTGLPVDSMLFLRLEVPDETDIELGYVIVASNASV